MAKLVYGNGIVSLIDASNVAGIEMNYQGAFEFSSLCKDLNTKILASKDKILLYILKKNHSIDGDLFMYRGELKITRVIVSDWSAKKIPTSISSPGLAIAESLISTSETMTINSENMKNSSSMGSKIGKTKPVSKDKIIKHLLKVNRK